MSNIIDRVKLPFQKNSQLRKALYDILGKYPHNLDLYREALAHRSQQYRGRNGQEKPVNNERLEFLGDAVLEATVSHIVFQHFPSRREGFLTNTRSKLVQRETLNRLAARMGIIDLIHANVNSPSHNSNVGGNAFEALVGALYLDHGYQTVLAFVQKKMMDSRTLDLDDTAQKETNFKSKLLEWAQKNKLQCEFRVDDEISRDGNSEFHTSVVIEGIVCGEGQGFSKKQAEQETARHALTRLRHEDGFKDRVFGGKEQRTAMEAEEYAALPRIAEIDHTSNAGSVPATGKKKPVRRREGRSSRSAQKSEATSQSNNAQTGQPSEKQQAAQKDAPQKAPQARPDQRENAERRNNGSERNRAEQERKVNDQERKANDQERNRADQERRTDSAEGQTETPSRQSRQDNRRTDRTSSRPQRNEKAKVQPADSADSAEKPAEPVGKSTEAAGKSEKSAGKPAEPKVKVAPAEAAAQKSEGESRAAEPVAVATEPVEKKKRATRRHRPAKRAPGMDTGNKG